MAKLSVHLVAWNGAKYIPYLFESLRKQTYKDWELLAIDNASAKDNTADLIEKELQNNGEGVLRFLGGFHGEQRGRHTGTMRRQKTNDPANHKGRLYLHRLADQH